MSTNVHASDDPPKQVKPVGGLGVPKAATWVVEPEALQGVFEATTLANPWFHLVSADGYVLHTTELVAAPGYVAPVSFVALYDNPDYPFEIRLEMDGEDQTEPLMRGTFEPRSVNLRQSKLPLPKWPLRRSDRRWIGIQPKIHWPKLQREALAHAAMPHSRPHIDEIGYHVDDVLPKLDKRRKPQVMPEQRALMRDAYVEALRMPELRTKEARLTHVQDRLSEVWPDDWPATGWYRRLRPFADEMDAELERVGGLGSLSLQPGSFKLPKGWLDAD